MESTQRMVTVPVSEPSFVFSNCAAKRRGELYVQTWPLNTRTSVMDAFEATISVFFLQTVSTIGSPRPINT